MKTQLQANKIAAGRVLVVDDHQAARESIADVLRHTGHQVECRGSAREALRVLQDDAFDVVVTDLQMPGMSGLEFIQHVQRQRMGVQMVMVTAHATVASAVEAMRHGAFDYIEKPFDVEQLEQRVNQALERGRLLDRGLAWNSSGGGQSPVMIGSSVPMRQLRDRIAQVAPTSETVLISGESGTGKELVAHSIHAASRRAASPLVGLNCPVLSAQLMESELFGHERGAFTGADAPRTGRFELADGGTILLDEISEIDLGVQAKLLRVLQEMAFERVGSSKTIRIDVRVLATTNRDLLTEIRESRFRQDLYFRLAVVPIQVPPLRQRPSDVIELVDYFLRRAAERLSREPAQLRSSAAELLVDYHWPGNIRELENLITRACVLCQGEPISADDLRPWLIDADGNSPSHETSVPVGLSLEEMEKKLIVATLEHFDGHRAKTAQALGIGLRTLSGKLKAYGYAPRTKSFAHAEC
ncbi:MAG: sigma-54 dependent transcriptional regulator [Pirellulales bacterium]